MVIGRTTKLNIQRKGTRMSFSWKCPFCRQHVTIIDEQTDTQRFTFHMNNKYGQQCAELRAIVCPNPKCREYSLTATLCNTQRDGYGAYQDGPVKDSWRLVPRSSAEVYPDYVPAPIRADYEEACAIVNLSPKASGTLSRRCIQGMIRDFWGIKKGRLIDEINELQGKVQSEVWDAIDSVRSVGNIGAHMEKDINIIVDVDPGEAEQLIKLIEILMEDWYITRNERQKHLASVKQLAQKKKAQQAGP
jgi:hypothetical protein